MQNKITNKIFQEIKDAVSDTMMQREGLKVEMLERNLDFINKCDNIQDNRFLLLSMLSLEDIGYIMNNIISANSRKVIIHQILKHL